jgi:hypothetical protein
LPEYTIVSPAVPFTIAPGAHQDVVIRFAPLAPIAYNATLTIVSDAATSPDSYSVTGTGQSHAMAQGWNLVSVPVTVPDFTASVVFPGKLADMYKYEGGAYVPAPTLANGSGYWAYYTAATTEVVTGTVVNPMTVSLTTGWNIIGSREVTVQKAALTTDPADQILADIYRYSGGAYVTATDIKPGEGVWVYVTGACTLTIP